MMVTLYVVIVYMTELSPASGSGAKRATANGKSKVVKIGIHGALQKVARLINILQLTASILSVACWKRGRERG